MLSRGSEASQGAKRTADNQDYARLKNLLAALSIKKGIAKKNGVKGPRAGCVVAVNESPAGRERAASFCEFFKKQSSAEVEPAVRGFSFGSLNLTAESLEALKNAVRADLIIFAVTSAGDLPPEVRLWRQHCPGKRGEREGSLVGLILGEAVHPGQIACLKEIYPRHLAHRAGVDHLCHVPPMIPEENT